MQMNTAKACRSEEFMAPTLCDRSTYEKWDGLGRPDMYDKAKERVVRDPCIAAKRPAAG